MTDVPIPECIKGKLQQLNQLVEKYPDKIPLPAVAGFMGITENGLRAFIDNNPNSFGMSWRQTGTAAGIEIALTVLDLSRGAQAHE